MMVRECSGERSADSFPNPLILRAPSGALRVWAGPVGPTASVAGVRAGSAFGRKSARGSLRSGAGDPELERRERHQPLANMFTTFTKFKKHTEITLASFSFSVG